MYEHINPLNNEYGLVSIKRECIPNKVYSLFITIFGNKIGTKQPFRWIIFKEIKK
jgi:hypothetical protein